MTTRQVDAKDAVARGLGWFSLALGTAQVAAPRSVARLLQLRAGGEQAVVMRAVGVREIATGVGILARPKPAAWLWARVVGDAVDMTLLAKADGEPRGKLAGIVAVAGVAVPDLIESARLSRLNGETPDRTEVSVTKAITVRRPPPEVYAFWRDFEVLPRFMEHLESVEIAGDRRSHWRARGPAGRPIEWDAEIVDDRPAELIAWRSLPGADVPNSGAVRFVEAPGDQGTEVTVELRYAPPAGDLGLALAKLAGEEPGIQLADDLRRFKQIMETGDIVRSDATPRGHSILEHLTQRPAQPIGGGAR
jgi:uncharacterized membrane protein